MSAHDLSIHAYVVLSPLLLSSIRPPPFLFDILAYKVLATSRRHDIGLMKMDTSFDLNVVTLERRDVGATLSILLLYTSIQCNDPYQIIQVFNTFDQV